jgi:hypothetical protein
LDERKLGVSRVGANRHNTFLGPIDESSMLEVPANTLELER